MAIWNLSFNNFMILINVRLTLSAIVIKNQQIIFYLSQTRTEETCRF